MKKKTGVYGVIYIALLCLMPFSNSVIAAAPQYIPVDAEIRYLPAYCAAKLRGIDEQRWRAIIGKDFQHLHHMCYAQNARRKARTERDEQSRQYLNSVALKEYGYMETHVSLGFALLVAVYLEKADVFWSMKQNAKAEAYYLKAIKFKPDYVKSYASYSNFLKRTGQKERAREVLEQGLKVKPASKSLKRRLKKLKDDI